MLFAAEMRFKDGDDSPCEIEKGLYLGSANASNNKVALKSLNVTHVLTVAHRLPPPYPDDFTYKIIPVPDMEHINIAQFFVECYVFIEEAKRNGGSVFVHCIAGVSRSATIVLAYLMIKHGMSLDEAMEYVKKKRPVIFPNYGFRTQLGTLEKSLQDRWFGFTFRVAVAKRRMLEALLYRARNLRK